MIYLTGILIFFFTIVWNSDVFKIKKTGQQNSPQYHIKMSKLKEMPSFNYKNTSQDIKNIF